MRLKVVLQVLFIFGVFGICFTQDKLSTFNNDTDLSTWRPGKFAHFKHGVESGYVHIVNDRTILIESLYYDGLAPDAHFYIGKGQKPNANGTIIADENGVTKHPLNEYRGQNVTLELPVALTVFDVDWLAIWCGDSGENFGHVMLNSKYELAPKHIQLSGEFHQSAAVSSGPILLISNDTFLITNFYFDQIACNEGYFQAGLKNKINETLLDESGSYLALVTYDGIDTYARIPTKIGISDIEYLQIWCKTKNTILGLVRLPSNLDGLPDDTRKSDGPRLIRVPKCCPHNTVLMTDGCQRSDVTINLDIAVLEGNRTHVNDVKLENIIFDYYIYNTPCSKYPVYPEEVEYALSTSGYLLMPQEKDKLKKDKYCFDSIVVDNLNGSDDIQYLSTVLMCFTDEDTPEAAYIIYYICISISAFFLGLTFAIFTFYSFKKEYFSSIRSISIIFFTLSLGCSFTILAISQSLRPDGITCDILGYFFQLFLVSSFTWLTILSRETFYRIKHERNREVRCPKRIRKYIIIGILVPIGIFFLSFIVDKFVLHQDPLKVKLGYSNCWFRSYGIVFYYYVPILIEILISFVYWYRTRSLIIELEKQEAPQTKFKIMNRSNFIILSIMALCWVLEVVTYLMEISAVTIFITVLEALQGCFIFLIYILHDPVKTIIWGDLKDLWFNRKGCAKSPNGRKQEVGEELTTLKSNGSIE